MKKEIFKGVGTAVITPMKKGKIDYASFDLLLQKQIDAKVGAVVVLGTTGEPCTITKTEREKIIKFAVQKCMGKIKVIVGCGSNDTKLAVKYYRQAEKLKADGALIVTPYYNKCTQAGIIEHYKLISRHGRLPIIAYNVPSRTGVNILPDTMLKLSDIENVCGVKEASGNINQILDYFRLLGNKISIYSGEDALNSIFIAFGGSGVISVASNVFPKLVKKVCDLAEHGLISECNELQLKLLPVIKDLFLEVNPIPVKHALNYLGICQNELRLPLTPMSKDKAKVLEQDINALVGDINDCL